MKWVRKKPDFASKRGRTALRAVGSSSIDGRLRIIKKKLGKECMRMLIWWNGTACSTNRKI